MHPTRYGEGTAWLVMTALGWALAGCGGAEVPATVADISAADTLWVPDQASIEEQALAPVLIKDGRGIYRDGSATVVFSIAIPCDDVARSVTAHFADTEWRPRPRQWLSPALPTSFGSGCQRQGGGLIAWNPGRREVPAGPYEEWRGEWENKRGDILTYSLGGIEGSVRGAASYVPRQVADAARGKRRR